MNNLPLSTEISSSEKQGSQNPSRYNTGFHRPFCKQILGGLASKTGNCNISNSDEQKRGVKLRFQLQRLAKEILRADKWKTVQKCFKVPVSYVLSVNHSKESGRAYFGGLSICGTIWACPVCSYKIASLRCRELENGIGHHLAKSPSNDVVMVGMTNHHSRHDLLNEMISARSDALIEFYGQKGVKNILRDIGYVGRVTSTEITYSKLNGWHPHNHSLFFTSKPVNQESLREALAPYWVNALDRSGLSGSSEVALKVTGGKCAGDYVSSMAMEITLSLAKRGREVPGGVPRYSPFQLLDFILLNRGSEVSTAWAERAFYEYADSMYRRRALVYSDGLKKYLQVPEVSDMEASRPNEDDLQEFCRFHNRYWHIIRNYRHVKDDDRRGVLLSVAEKYGKEACESLLESWGVKLIGKDIFSHYKENPEENMDGLQEATGKQLQAALLGSAVKAACAASHDLENIQL